MAHSVFLRDRFSLGVLAGLIANLLPYIIEFIPYYAFNVKFVRLIDYAAVLIFGRFSENALEGFMAFLGQSVFASLAGVLFAFLIKELTYRNYLLKGFFYSLALWFFINAAALAFQMPGLEDLSTLSAATDLISSAVYGLILARVLYKLDPISNESDL